MLNFLLDSCETCPRYPGYWPDKGNAWHAWDSHVLALVIPGLILCVFFFSLGIKLRYKIKKANLVYFLLGLFLLIFEIYKQFTYNKIRGFDHFNGYAFEIFPFQLCSIPMFIALIMPFIKVGNKRDTLIAFVGVYATIGGTVTIFYNQKALFWWSDIGIYIHTITWHLVLMMLGLFSITYLKIGKGHFLRNLKIYFNTLVIFISFTLIAQFINFIVPFVLGRCDCMAFNANMFYISMYYPSTIWPLKQLWELSPGPLGYGWVLAYLVYLLALTIFSFLVMIIYYILYRLFSKFKFKYRVSHLKIQN